MAHGDQQCHWDEGESDAWERKPAFSDPSSSPTMNDRSRPVLSLPDRVTNSWKTLSDNSPQYATTNINFVPLIQHNSHEDCIISGDDGLRQAAAAARVSVASIRYTYQKCRESTPSRDYVSATKKNRRKSGTELCFSVGVNTLLCVNFCGWSPFTDVNPSFTSSITIHRHTQAYILICTYTSTYM